MPAIPRIALTTSDGVQLSAAHWDAGGREVGCVVAHGFTGSSRKPHVQAICRELHTAGFGVLAPDLRGHGASDGACTAGADEPRDIDACVRWLRAQGYRRVAALGWSMGGSAVLRYAGLGGDADAVVSVSSPGEWFERGTRAMRLVHWMCEARTGRFATRVVRRTRIAETGWPRVPEAPGEVVGAIAPTPLLIVHGDADHYFPARHVEVLAAAAPGADVWLEAGMGHAETATSAELVARIAAWIAASVAAVSEPVEVCHDEPRD